MQKYITIGVLVVIIIASIFFLFPTKTQNHNEKKSVALSTFALYDIAKNISGDTIDLLRIIPLGKDIHSYEPTPQIMAKLEKSDVVIYSGAGLEPWIHTLTMGNEKVDMARHVDLLTVQGVEHEAHEGTCSHGVHDPHYWLDVHNMKRAALFMTDVFVDLSPQHRKLYAKNLGAYLTMLDTLDRLYKDTLSVCKRDTIVVNHNAYSYLSNKYGFYVEPLKGLSPDAQSSPKEIIRVMEVIEKSNTQTIFFENFTSSTLMQTLAEEKGVKLDSLQPLANITKDEAQLNASYEDIMKRNLFKIAGALECQ